MAARVSHTLPDMVKRTNRIDGHAGDAITVRCRLICSVVVVDASDAKTTQAACSKIADFFRQQAERLRVEWLRRRPYPGQPLQIRAVEKTAAGL